MSFVEELFGLDGKVVVVTGASEGLGRHFATILAKAGASVVAGARTVSKLDSLVQEITAAGGTAAAHPLDVTKAQSLPSVSPVSGRLFIPCCYCWCSG